MRDLLGREGSSGMFLAPRTPLHIGRPSGKPFSEPGRMVGTCRWIWIHSGSEQLFSQSNVEFLWCSKVGSCLISAQKVLF